MTRLILVIGVLFGTDLDLQASPPPEFRKWTNATETRTVTAAFVRLDDNGKRGTFLRPDMTEVTVGLDKLSGRDREYIRSLTNAERGLTGNTHTVAFQDPTSSAPRTDVINVFAYDLQGNPAAAPNAQPDNRPFEIVVNVFARPNNFETQLSAAGWARDLLQNARPIAGPFMSTGGAVTVPLGGFTGPVVLVFSRVGQENNPTAVSQIVAAGGAARQHTLHVVVPDPQQLNTCPPACKPCFGNSRCPRLQRFRFR